MLVDNSLKSSEEYTSDAPNILYVESSISSARPSAHIPSSASSKSHISIPNLFASYISPPGSFAVLILFDTDFPLRLSEIIFPYLAAAVCPK